MKRILSVALAGLLILILNGTQSYAQRVPSSQSTIHLFNGKNFDGWYKFLKNRGRNNDPNQVFTVKDGMINISGTEFGCITTNEEYSNYKLVVEYKYDTANDRLPSPSRVDGVARDGGILLHSVGEDGGYSGIWMHSIEVNIIEGGTGDFIVVGDGSDKYSITAQVAPDLQGSSYIYDQGSDYLATIYGGRINWKDRDPSWDNVKGFWGKKDLEYPLGNWNTVECLVLGDKITVYLNGILVNEGIKAKPAKGRIQIQSEAAPMVIRKVDLIPLKNPPPVIKKPEPIALFNGKDLDGWEVYGTEKWYVDKDRTLVCESGPDKEYGYLATQKKFKDFVLTARFLQEANGNSGIFFHSSVTGTKIKGFQAEVAPPGLHSGGIYESYGRGWLAIPDSSKESALRMGQWNAMMIRVKGDTVDTWLNGAHMIHLVDGKIKEEAGQIALQIHSGGGIKIRWKDLWIRELQ